MNILFYFPTNKGSVSLETLMEEFRKKGHQVFLLGWEPKGDIHKTVEQYGVRTATLDISKTPSWKFYWKHLRFLNRFIRKNKIDLVYSHTQPVNIVAVFAQFFVSAKFFICRHHSDYIQNEGNRNAVLFDRVINKLGKQFIVPSKKVFHQITKVEGVAPKKVRLINYAYNFDHYPKPDLENVERIRKESPAKMQLVAVSRFIPCKRYDQLIESIAELKQAGYNIHLNILGVGPLLGESKELVSKLNLNNEIKFIGFTTKAIDYMAASDIVVHFSDSEASNSVIKEAGLIKKIVAVCNDVGDFDDYIGDEKEGFKLAKDNPKKSLHLVIEKTYDSLEKWSFMGENLNHSVLENFSKENVIEAYTEI